MKALLTALRCEKGDDPANLQRHLALMENAAARGADIVVFPEMSLTGSVDPGTGPAGRSGSHTRLSTRSGTLLVDLP